MGDGEADEVVSEEQPRQVPLPVVAPEGRADARKRQHTGTGRDNQEENGKCERQHSSDALTLERFTCDVDRLDGAIIAHHDGWKDGFPNVVGAF